MSRIVRWSLSSVASSNKMHRFVKWLPNCTKQSTNLIKKFLPCFFLTSMEFRWKNLFFVRFWYFLQTRQNQLQESKLLAILDNTDILSWYLTVSWKVLIVFPPFWIAVDQQLVKLSWHCDGRRHKARSRGFIAVLFPKQVPSNSLTKPSDYRGVDFFCLFFLLSLNTFFSL